MNCMQLFLIIALFSSCYFREDPTVVDAKSKVQGVASLTKVSVKDNTFIIDGSGFSGVKKVQIKGHGIDQTLNVDSNNGTKIVASALSSLNIGLNKVFSLVLSDAYGAVTYQVDFTIPSMGAGDGDVLMYNLGTAAWEPRPLNNINLVGTWNASTNTPALSDGGAGTTPVTGDYYVVSTAGTTALDGTNAWNAGDWVMFNGTTWEKITNNSVVASFNGRQGVVVPMEADYTLNLLGDVDTTGAAAGKVLKFDGTNWIVGDDFSSSGGAVNGTAANYTGSGTQLTLGHDSSNNTTMTVDSVGFTTFNASGTGPTGYNFAGGNVGIGNVSPGEELDVTGDIRASTSVMAPLLSNTGHLNLTADSDTDGVGDLIFNTGANERIRVLNNGNVGIGTNNPGNKLDIRGTNPLLTIGNAATVGERLELKYDSSGNFGWIRSLTTSGANGNLVIQPDGGNLGIGTSLPLDKLHINTAVNHNLLVRDDATGGVILQSVQDNGTSSASLQLKAGPTVGVHVTGPGDVGIGKTNPDGKLDVAGSPYFGTGTTDTRLYLRGHNGAHSEILTNAGVGTNYNGLTFSNNPLGTGGLPNWVFDIGGGDNINYANADSISFRRGTSEYMRIASGGNVGIGTPSPGRKLYVYGTGNPSIAVDAPAASHAGVEWFSAGTALFNLYRGAGTSDLRLYDATAAADTVTFKGGGNVGIGVPSPTAKLEVDGQIVSQEHDAGAATSIDWNNGNVQITSAAPGAITFTNMLPGGSYVLVCTNATSGTFTFSHAGLAFRFKPANGATTASSHTIYNFFRAGSNVYVTWSSGF